MYGSKQKKMGLQVHYDFIDDIVTLFFCLVYILSIVFVLKPNLMSADVIVTSYSKSFSLIKSFISVCMVLFVKYISYNLVNIKGSFAYYLVRVLFFLYEIPIILSFGLFYFDNYHIFWISEIVYWLILCVVLNIYGNVK